MGTGTATASAGYVSGGSLPNSLAMDTQDLRLVQKDSVNDDKDKVIDTVTVSDGSPMFTRIDYELAPSLYVGDGLVIDADGMVIATEPDAIEKLTQTMEQDNE